ncbi:MAG: peptidylprolyl isomerase, partial [Oscillospiraceae bacterium]
WLDFRHTVFGHVLEGMDTVDEIANVQRGPQDRPVHDVVIETIEISEPMDVVDNLTVVYGGFADAVEGIAPLTITPEQALRVMKVMEAAFESAQKGITLKTNI